MNHSDIIVNIILKIKYDHTIQYNLLETIVIECRSLNNKLHNKYFTNLIDKLEFHIMYPDDQEYADIKFILNQILDFLAIQPQYIYYNTFKLAV